MGDFQFELSTEKIIYGAVSGLVIALISLVKRTYNTDIKTLKKEHEDEKKLKDGEIRDLWDKLEKERGYRLIDNKALNDKIEAVDRKTVTICGNITAINERCNERKSKE